MVFVKIAFSAWIQVALWSLYIFTFCGCDSQSDLEADPILSISTDHLDFGVEQTMLTFHIQNTGQGILNWNITNAQGWISATLSGRSTSDESHAVEVRVIRTDLPPGLYEGRVLISSNGGEAAISISMKIAGDLSFGIFSETTPTRLVPDVDAFIGTFSGGGAVFNDFLADSTEKAEGLLSLKSTLSVEAARNQFAGWFISWGASEHVGNDSFTRDMLSFMEGRLLFWVKSPINLEVGIRTGNIRAGEEESKILLNDIASFAADNTWRQVCIPLVEFVSRDVRTDFSQVKVFFVISSSPATGGTGGTPRSFWVDDIRWEHSDTGPACP